MKDSYLQVDIGVKQKAGRNNVCAHNNHIGLVYSDPIALFNKHKLTSSNGKEKQIIERAHIAYLLYILIKYSIDSADLSIGSHRCIIAREQEITFAETTKSNYQAKSFTKDVFDFSEHQKVATYGLGYKLTLPRNRYFNVSSHRPEAGAEDAARRTAPEVTSVRIFISDLNWYVFHFTPNISQQKLY